MSADGKAKTHRTGLHGGQGERSGTSRFFTISERRPPRKEQDKRIYFGVYYFLRKKDRVIVAKVTERNCILRHVRTIRREEIKRRAKAKLRK